MVGSLTGAWIQWMYLDVYSKADPGVFVRAKSHKTHIVQIPNL